MWRVWVRRGVYRVLVGTPEGKRPLGRPRRRWVDIRMDLQEVGCGYMDWIGLAQDRDRWQTLVNAVMNLWVPWNVGNFLTSCKPVSFSRRSLHHGVSKYTSQIRNTLESLFCITHTSEYVIFTKVKEASSLSELWRHIEEAEVLLHSLILALEGSEWSTSCPSHFTPGTEPLHPLYSGQLFIWWNFNLKWIINCDPM